MKAVVRDQYGAPDLLRLEEVEKPLPSDNQVLVKVRAVSINGSDWEGLRGKPLYARMGGLRKPGNRILGSDVAGRAEAVGKDITQFRPGDEVFGETLTYSGGFAEYVCIPERGLIKKPGSLTFEQAAAIPQGATIAFKGIRDKGQVQPGQHVLINGAGGSAGPYAIQLAKMHGAEVTAVDNGVKLEFLRALGADHVIDYTRQNYTKNRNQYDLILDVIAHRSAFAVQRALKIGGTYYVVGGSVGVFFQILLFGGLIRRTTGKNVRILVASPNQKDLQVVTNLCEQGKLTPMIDRQYPLEQVRDAMQYVGEGRAKGKVVITVE